MLRTALPLLSVLFLCAFFLFGLARVQTESGKVTGPLAEHPAARMVGLWRGTTSRKERDGAWHEAAVTERARWNLAGSAILVEGYGYSDDPVTGERTVGHDAFGLIEHVKATNEVRFYARRAGADFERYAFEVNPETGAMRWSPKGPEGVSIRFIISVTDDRWHEVGEVSVDGGKTWEKFLEMRLSKVGEGTPAAPGK